MKGKIMDPIEHLLQFFSSDHLPEHLRRVSWDCSELAVKMALALPRNPETTVGLRKLLEAKDAFVRSALLDRKSADEAAERGG